MIVKSISKFIILSLIMMMTVNLVGCWDYTEVESRGYVLAIAIDKNQPLPRGQDELEEYLSERDIERMVVQEGSPKYAYTIQVPIIAEGRNKPAGASGGGSGGDRTWDLTIEGNNFFEVNRQFATRLDFPAFYEHLKVIVISEEVARDGIHEVLDMLLRDHEIRRRTRVFVTPGEAKKVLDVVPRIEDYLALYLEKLPLGAKKTSRILHKTDLGEISKSIHGGTDFVLPRIVATKDEIKDAGSAVFKEDKMIGWLGEIDSIYLKWIRDAVLGGVIVVDSPHPSAQLVVCEVVKAKVKVRPVIENDNIIMDVNVNATFNLSEEFRTAAHNTLEQDFLEEVERRIEKKLETEIKGTIRYIQQTFGSDIVHFNIVMQRYAPSVWEDVENDWHDIFPHIETRVKADAEIRMIGLIK
jgi:Ger(x)C family germination protein